MMLDRLTTERAELETEIAFLRKQLAEWKHRAIGGTCEILSKSDRCECAICFRDREIERLREENEGLRRTTNRTLDMI